MAVYNVFGFSSDDLEHVRAALEDCLGIHFVARESSFRGEYYSYNSSDSSEEVMLERNVDPEEGGPLYLEYKDFPTVMHVSIADNEHEIGRSEKLCSTLLLSTIAGCRLLKHTVRPD